MKKSPSRRFSFTLLELLLAMTIFAVLMLLLFQIFSNQQSVVSTSNKRVEVAENGRIVLDMLARDLQMAYYAADHKRSFYLGTSNTPDCDSIAFAACTNLKPNSGCIAQTVEIGYNVFTTTDADNNTTSSLFYRMIGDGGDFASTADADSATKWDFASDTTITSDNLFDETIINSFDDKKYLKIIDNVVKFKVTPFTITSSASGSTTGVGFSPWTTTYLPGMVKVELELLDTASWIKWSNAPAGTFKDTVKERNTRKFSRMIFLPDLGQNPIIP